MGKHSYVYFILAPVANMVKIGVAINLKDRFTNLSNMSPIPIKMLCAMPGSYALENKLHHKFKHLRDHGEWFRYEGELLYYCENLIKSNEINIPHRERTITVKDVMFVMAPIAEQLISKHGGTENKGFKIEFKHKTGIGWRNARLYINDYFTNPDRVVRANSTIKRLILNHIPEHIDIPIIEISENSRLRLKNGRPPSRETLHKPPKSRLKANQAPQ